MQKDDQPSILYVDDEPANLRVFEANFRVRFRVLTCSSGRAALEILAERGQEIGILITDQRMPEMTGIELLERARDAAPDAQRMLITAYSDMQAVIDAVNRGQAVRYFVKPWAREELAVAFDASLRVFTLQARLREMQVRILQSERLATLGQVTAGIAHELMTPLTYVTQNVDVLKRELETVTDYLEPALERVPSEPVRQALDELPRVMGDVELGVGHLRGLALGIRTQARGVDVEDACELSEVAQFAAKLARGEVARRARLSTAGEPVRVAIGPVKLTQVLLNLIVNASHAMEGRDRLGQIEVGWRKQEGGAVLLYVRDDGCGMSEEVRRRAFEPMFTTKPVGVGTGLGLAICRDAIVAAGGEIRVFSEVGVGTTVEVTLPLAP